MSVAKKMRWDGPRLRSLMAAPPLAAMPSASPSLGRQLAADQGDVDATLAVDEVGDRVDQARDHDDDDHRTDRARGVRAERVLGEQRVEHHRVEGQGAR